MFYLFFIIEKKTPCFLKLFLRNLFENTNNTKKMYYLICYLTVGPVCFIFWKTILCFQKTRRMKKKMENMYGCPFVFLCKI